MDPSRIAALLAPFLGGDTLTAHQLAQLDAYLDLLLRWNARMNLTAVRDAEQIVTRHFGESLFAARTLYPAGGKLETGNWKLVDLGSGAGFPGLPIKLWAPSLRVTLIESQHRKATFLREVVRTLHLREVEVLSTRAEDYAAQLETGNRKLETLTVTLRAVERFDQILPTAARLCGWPTQAGFAGVGRSRLALLIGAAQVARAHELLRRFTWSDPLPIPQSSARVLLLGHP